MEQEFELGQAVYYIQNHHDELPCIKEAVVAEAPQGFEDLPDYVYMVPPDQAPVRKPGVFWCFDFLTSDRVTSDATVATKWLLKAIDECIREHEAEIEALREYRAESET